MLELVEQRLLGAVEAVHPHYPFVPRLPFAGIEGDVQRKHHLLDLFLPGGDVKQDVSADILRNNSVRGHRDDRIDTIDAVVEARPNVCIVEQVTLVTSDVLGVNGFLTA